MLGFGDDFDICVDKSGTIKNNNNNKMTISESSKTESQSKFDTLVAPKPVKHLKEIDLKCLDFIDLILKLDEEILLEQLEKVYNFLNNNDDELEFPDIPEELEEVLVHIVKEVNRLSSGKIYSTCQKVCKQIVDTVKLNTQNKVYMLVCVHKVKPVTKNELLKGLGVDSERMLVYKKLYYAQSAEKSPSVDDTREVNSTLSNTPPLSRSSSLDSLASQTSTYRVTVPSEKKYLSYLRVILNFVKDKNLPNLRVDYLTALEADFIYSLFSSVIDNKKITGIENKRVCKAICEAYKIFSIQYEFRVRYVDNNNVLIAGHPSRSLHFEKICKMNIPETVNIVEVKETQEKHQLMKKSVMRFKQFLTGLPPEFVEHNLKKILNFFSDDTEASIIFTTMGGEKKRFLKNVINYCRSPNLKSVFPEDQRKMLDNLKALVDSKVGYKLRIKEKKRPCGERELLYIKVPQFDKPAPNSRPWYPQLQMVDPKPSGAKRNKSSAKRKELAQQVPDFRLARTAAFSRVWAQQYSTQNNGLNQDGKMGQPLNIKFQSAGVMNQKAKNDSSLVLQSEKDFTLLSVMRKYDQEVKDLPRALTSQPPTIVYDRNSSELKTRPGTLLNRGNTMKTVQLIEALSVPVKCDKAMRMMKGMGWDGGGLGTAGQGIKEPLMPHLSGFVVSKPQAQPKPLYPAAPTACVSNNKRESAKFRRTLLAQLLQLLRAARDRAALQLHPELNKKEHRFIKHALRSFAARERVHIADEDKHLVDEVLEEYEKDPELLVSACISDDKKQIMLTKLHSPLLPLHSKAKSRVKYKYINIALTDNVKTVMDAYTALCQTQSTYDATKFKVEILVKVLEFVKDESKNEFKMEFESVLTMKQRSFIEMAIESANKRRQFGGSSPEIAVAMEIKRLMKDYRMRVKIAPDFKSFTATKERMIKRNGKTYTAEELASLYSEDSNKTNDKHTKTNEKVNDESSEESTDEEDSVDEYSKYVGEEIKENINDANLNHDKITSIETDKNNRHCNKNREVIDKTRSNINQTLPKVKVISEDIATLYINNKFNIEDDEMREVNDNDSNLFIFDSSFDSSNDASNMSTSDHSAYTTNLNYNETDDDISMVEVRTGDHEIKIGDDDIVKCDKPLELSFKCKAMLYNEAKDDHSQNVEQPEKDVKIVFLTKSYFLTTNLPKYIQGIISLNIVQNKELPLLKCHGIYDDALIYSCHTKKSYDWLQNVCVANNITMNVREFSKMSLKINSYFEFDDHYFFNMLELYNKELSTKKWVTLDKQVSDNSVILNVEMDRDSCRYILDAELSLYAGVDNVVFTILWE